MEVVQSIIEAIRSERGRYNISPAVNVNVILKTDRNEIKLFADTIKTLAKVDNLSFEKDVVKPKLSTSAVVNDIEIYLLLEGIIDIDKEKEKINKEIIKLENQIISTNKMLSNESFTSNAPEHVINNEKDKLVQLNEKIIILKNNLISFG